MFVPWDPLSPCPVPLAPLVTSLMLRLWVTVIHVQLAPSTTCMPRRLVFPVAAPPPHQLVRAYQLILDYNLCSQLRSHQMLLSKTNIKMDVIIRQSLHDIPFNSLGTYLKYLDNIGMLCHTFSQDLLLVPVLARTVPSSTRMVHVCAELVLSSTMNWILKALPLTVDWTANLRSVAETDTASTVKLESPLQ